MCPLRPSPPKTKAQKVAKAASVLGCAVLVTLVCPFACVYLGIQCVCDRYEVLMPRVNRRVQASRQRAEKKKTMKKEAPEYLGKRKRALTLPLPDQRNGFLPRKPAQCTKDQSQSTFFGRVPYEIREMIYEYAFAGFLHIHLFRRTDRRLGHYICHGKHREGRRPLKESPDNCCGTACKSSTGAWIPETWVDDHISEVLPLLGTCRKLCVVLIRKSGSNIADPLKGTPRVSICSTVEILSASMILRPSATSLELSCRAVSAPSRSWRFI